MLVLKNIEDCKKCDVNIDYYVPFTICIECDNKYSARNSWRTGNLKKSLIEVALDANSGALRDITLTAIDNAVLVDTLLEKANDVESGTPLFYIEGDTKNGIYDEIMNFTVFLGLDFIMVKLKEDTVVCKYIELERVRFGIDDNNRLISIIVKNLTEYERHELKDSLKL